MIRKSKVLGTAAALATVFAFTTQALAVDARVRSACMADYFAYCSQHDPDGPGVRRGDEILHTSGRTTECRPRPRKCAVAIGPRRSRPKGMPSR